jgi:hypothetical protein
MGEKRETTKACCDNFHVLLHDASGRVRAMLHVQPLQVAPGAEEAMEHNVHSKTKILLLTEE